MQADRGLRGKHFWLFLDQVPCRQVRKA
eukprot:COSAG01_NODE_19537_length_1004_cov_1.844199_1_plen_27_part_10